MKSIKQIFEESNQIVKDLDKATSNLRYINKRKQTFEDYLGEQMFKDEPESVRSKDTWEDDFDNWLSRLDAQEFIDYADKWGETLI